MTALQALVTVGVVALVTLMTRALPFLLFPANKRTPAFILYLGRVLPYAIIGMLVVYCVKDVSLAAAPHGLPEALAILAVAGLHLWRKNTLLSIGGGLALYMAMVQGIF